MEQTGRQQQEDVGEKCAVCQRECVYSKAVKDVSQVKAAIQREETCKKMMTELGGDAKSPDLWRMSALPDMRPKDVKDSMLMRLDEIREKIFENLKTKVMSYAFNKLQDR